MASRLLAVPPAALHAALTVRSVGNSSVQSEYAPPHRCPTAQPTDRPDPDARGGLYWHSVSRR